MDDWEFRVLAEHSVDMICLVCSDLIMRYASPACTDLLGWHPAEMIGKGPDEFVHPDDLQIVIDAHRELRERGERRFPTVVRMRCKEGGYVWMETTARRVPDTAHADYRVVLVMRDISARMNMGELHIPPPGGEACNASDAVEEIITAVDLHLTQSGQIAFIERKKVAENGSTIYEGYVLDKASQSRALRLEWLPCGHCITTGNDHHRIVGRV